MRVRDGCGGDVCDRKTDDACGSGRACTPGVGGCCGQQAVPLAALAAAGLADLLQPLK
jgi:hypothetical protein